MLCLGAVRHGWLLLGLLRCRTISHRRYLFHLRAFRHWCCALLVQWCLIWLLCCRALHPSTLTFLLMRVQQVTILEYHITVVTENCCLCHMGLLVFLQLNIPGCCITTLVTFEWLFSSVGTHVRLKLVWLNTCECTVITTVWSYTCNKGKIKQKNKYMNNSYDTCAIFPSLYAQSTERLLLCTGC